MDRIQSFSIDHTRLEKGIYISRIDRAGTSWVTTFDLRMKTPYREPALSPAAAHTLEHCLATYLRNDRDDIIYVGPMGCMTGFYVIVEGKKEELEIIPSLIKAFDSVVWAESIPGATEKECGNYTFMDDAWARKEAQEYIFVLKKRHQELERLSILLNDRYKLYKGCVFIK